MTVGILSENSRLTKDVYTENFNKTKKHIELQYSRYYQDLHTYNYIHHINRDKFKTYTSKILISTKKLCQIELLNDNGDEISNMDFGVSDIEKNNFEITSCISLTDEDEYSKLDLLPNELDLLLQLTPSGSNKYITGLIFTKTDYIEGINGAPIPKFNLNFATIVKDRKSLIIKSISNIDTYNVVLNKINTASNIIENISQFIRLNAKASFKESAANPYTSRYSVLAHRYTEDDINYYQRYIKNEGTQYYGLSTSPYLLLPNSQYYDKNGNVGGAAFLSNSVLETYLNYPISLKIQTNGSYSKAEFEDGAGTETLYVVKKFKNDKMDWFIQYDDCLLEGDINDNYEKLYKTMYYNRPIDINLRGLDDRGAVLAERELSEFENSYYITFKAKSIREYLKEQFNLKIDNNNYINPFYGAHSLITDKDFNFDILIDNGSYFVYPEYNDPHIQDKQIVDNFKIVLALPYVKDCIDTLKNCSNNSSYNYGYEGIYFKSYSLSIIR
jgi:mannose/fructose/N-acetylgalactosamine-specific phosphotransferase system component IIB